VCGKGARLAAARAIRRCGELLQELDARGAHREKGRRLPFFSLVNVGSES